MVHISPPPQLLPSQHTHRNELQLYISFHFPHLVQFLNFVVSSGSCNFFRLEHQLLAISDQSGLCSKAISWEDLPNYGSLFKKVYTLLSTSICLAHSLLCIYSIACTPVYGYFYFLFPASEECKFYILFYSVLFPQTPEIYLEYVCARVSHSVVSDSTTPCSPPGSFIHGILQARILEWVSISFSNKNIVGAK